MKFSGKQELYLKNGFQTAGSPVSRCPSLKFVGLIGKAQSHSSQGTTGCKVCCYCRAARWQAWLLKAISVTVSYRQHLWNPLHFQIVYLKFPITICILTETQFQTVRNANDIQFLYLNSDSSHPKMVRDESHWKGNFIPSLLSLGSPLWANANEVLVHFFSPYGMNHTLQTKLVWDLLSVSHMNVWSCIFDFYSGNLTTQPFTPNT